MRPTFENSPIVNLSEASPSIWRGGQPSADDWSWLKSIGVTQVVKLNPESEGSDIGALAAGLDLFYSPISLTEQILTEPDLQAIRDVVGFIEQGTFIHCTHGQDRTGLVVGVFRVTREGWTKEAAYLEMLKHGFHPYLAGLLKAWEDIV